MLTFKWAFGEKGGRYQYILRKARVCLRSTVCRSQKAVIFLGIMCDLDQYCT
jgi:hypothetical protein